MLGGGDPGYATAEPDDRYRLASCADVMVVPPDDDGNSPETLRDGLGALLRW